MSKYNIAMVYLNKDHNVGMGAGYIATTIMQQGHDLTFIDMAYNNVTTILSVIQKGNFDFLFLSANTLFYGIARQIATEVKRHKDIKVVLGGIHATIVREAVLRDNAAFDFVCIGEGEGFVKDFLQTYNTPEFFNIQNLIYRDPSGEIKTNTVRPCTDLKDLPPLRWDLFQDTSIVNPGPLPGFCYVFSTRGCPYRCTYCCNTLWLDLYKKEYLRRRSIEAVIAELQFLKKHYPVQTFYFADEMILFDMPYVTELMYRVKKEINLPYGCMTRVERVNPEVTKLFKETGCVYVGMGIECGNEKFRREFLNRHMTNEQIIYAYAELRKVPGLKTSSYNMKCYPVSYDDELTKDTLALNDLIEPDFVGMSVFYPFPGTKLYDYCVEHDKIDPAKYNNVTDYYGKSVLRG